MSKHVKVGSFRAHERVSISFEGEPSRTREEFAEECDINTIMRRYQKTGVVSHINPSAPRYLDLADVPDFQAAMNLMINAQEAFSSLPALVRREFDNDASKFVEFAENPDNVERMREWGLAPPAELEPAPQRVEIVNPAAPPLSPANDLGDAPKPSKTGSKKTD